LDLEGCPWASGSPSWVAYFYCGHSLGDLSYFAWAYVYLDHSFGITKEGKYGRTSKRAGRCQSTISQINFPRPRILKLQCQSLGRIQRNQRLDLTDEEEKQYRIMLSQAVNLKAPHTIETTVEYSLLVTVSVLQKLISFLGGQDIRKLPEPETSQNSGSRDQLEREISSVQARMRTRRPKISIADMKMRFTQDINLFVLLLR
jgi:hypothetical protein